MNSHTCCMLGTPFHLNNNYTNNRNHEAAITSHITDVLHRTSSYKTLDHAQKDIHFPSIDSTLYRIYDGVWKRK